MSHHKLQDVFHLIVTADDVQHSKPAPDGYFLALEKLGLKPHEALAFEDSEPGIVAARSAGVSVVHVERFAL